MTEESIRIEFRTEVSALGRNGLTIQKGIEIADYTDRLVELTPINSKNDSTRCFVQIPLESITEFILALNKFNPDPVRIDTSEKEFLDEVKSIQMITCPACGKKGFYEVINHREVKCELCNAEFEIKKLKDGFYFRPKV